MISSKTAIRNAFNACSSGVVAEFDALLPLLEMCYSMGYNHGLMVASGKDYQQHLCHGPGDGELT